MKMFINDLEKEKRNELIKKNKKLIDMLCNDLYEQQMFEQMYVADECLGKDYNKYLQYHNNYDSFYFTINDWKKFINNIDSDYLTDKGLVIYKEIMEESKKLAEMDDNEDKYYILEAKLEEKCKIVLSDLEQLLHEYEEPPSDEDAIQFADDMEQLDEYYIEIQDDGTSDNVICKDIAYTETYI